MKVVTEAESTTLMYWRKGRSQGASTGQASLFWGFLCFSILLHGILLAIYVLPDARHPSTVERRPIRGSLRAPVIRPAPFALSEPARAEPPRVVPPKPTVPSRKTEPAHRATPRPESRKNRQTSKERIATIPKPEGPAKPRFDIDELRAQARLLSRAPSDRLFGDPGANRNSINDLSRMQFPELTDRPVLEALAKRLGQPSAIIEEHVLSDGSRFVRFSDNTCLRIPRFLPLGRENQFTPTILVPMTCS